MIDIKKLWFLQRAGDKKKIENMIETIRDDGYLPPVEIRICEDGEMEISNGFHRVIAFWLSGKYELDRFDYIIWPYDGSSSRNRVGKIEKVLKGLGYDITRIREKEINSSAVVSK